MLPSGTLNFGVPKVFGKKRDVLLMSTPEVLWTVRSRLDHTEIDLHRPHFHSRL